MGRTWSRLSHHNHVTWSRHNHTLKQLFYTKTLTAKQQYSIFLFYIQTIVIHQKQILEEI